MKSAGIFSLAAVLAIVLLECTIAQEGKANPDLTWVAALAIMPVYIVFLFAMLWCGRHPEEVV